MNKYLVLLLLFLTGCGVGEPKYKLTQHVSYKVKPFYSLVCSGKGTIKDLFNISKTEYYIKDDNYDTPFQIYSFECKTWVEEKDIIEVLPEKECSK